MGTMRQVVPLPLHDLPGEAEHLVRRGRVQGGGVLVQEEEIRGEPWWP